MNIPVTWGAFKALPKEEQFLCLNELMDHGGNASSIAKAFGLSATAIFNHCRKNEIHVQWRNNKSNIDRENFLSWMESIKEKEITGNVVFQRNEVSASGYAKDVLACVLSKSGNVFGKFTVIWEPIQNITEEEM